MLGGQKERGPRNQRIEEWLCGSEGERVQGDGMEAWMLRREKGTKGLRNGHVEVRVRGELKF